MQPQDELENILIYIVCSFTCTHHTMIGFVCLFTVCGFGNAAFFACLTQ